MARRRSRLNPDEIIYTGELLEGDALGKEYRARRKDYLEDKVPKGQAPPEGWELHKEFKTFDRISKPKTIGDQLEDKVWTLLHDMGAQKLNTRKLILTLKIRGGKPRRREIDVLSVDQGVVFIVECKAKERLGKKNLRKEIADFAADMKPIRDAVKSLLGESSLQFVFVFATENIEWDHNDREDAKEQKLLVWDERVRRHGSERACLHSGSWSQIPALQPHLLREEDQRLRGSCAGTQGQDGRTHLLQFSDVPGTSP